VFFADIVYLPIYLFVIMGANVFSLIEKVERAENYVMLGYESEHDPLTGLLNRRAGEKRVRTLLQNKVAGIFAVIDIDDFKSFNDNCGHQAGDDVLCALGKTMLSVAGKDDVIWRLGGDEFAVYMVNMLDPDVCRQRFEAVMEKLKNTKAAQYESLNVRISAGGTLCKDANCDFENMYRMSDAALYESKNTGKGKVIIRTQGTY
jgi:diguanylate cyclase (GGDEF)-like protein